MEGLLGLHKSVNNREGALQELNTLERMNANVQNEKQQELEAQAQSEAIFEQAYQSADKLLGKDREVINNRIKAAQNNLKSHLRDNGGSRSQFMENGGLSVLNGIKNDIVKSDEMIRYEENKTNLAKIIEAKEKGFGHLLSPKDLRSVQAYEKNEQGGAITYGGIMTEIELPPSAAYEIGKDMPIEDIVKYDNNSARINANYMMYHDTDLPPTPKQRKDFAIAMNYGGVGTSVALAQAAARVQAARELRTQEAKVQAGKTSLVANLTNMFATVPQNINLETIYKSEEEGGYNGSYTEKMKAGGDESFNRIIGDKSKFSAIEYDANTDGIDVPMGTLPFNVYGRVFGDRLSLYDSYEVAPGTHMKVAAGLYAEQGIKMVDGVLVNYEPSEKSFRADGTQNSGDQKLMAGAYKENWTPKGMFTAMKTVTSQDGGNQETLIVNSVNKEGEVDPDSTKDYQEQLKNNVQMTMVMAFENAKGFVVYEELDLSQPTTAKLVGKSLGDYDDVSDVAKADNKVASEIAAQESFTEDQRREFNATKQVFDKEIFSDSVFEYESFDFAKHNTGGKINRNDLMTSYYMAVDMHQNGKIKGGRRQPNIYTMPKRVQDKDFTTSMAGANMINMLRDYENGMSDDNLITAWLNNANQDLLESGNHVQADDQSDFASLWMSMLSSVKS
jgi:hypothetical protein